MATISTPVAEAVHADTVLCSGELSPDQQMLTLAVQLHAADRLSGITEAAKLEVGISSTVSLTTSRIFWSGSFLCDGSNTPGNVCVGTLRLSAAAWLQASTLEHVWVSIVQSTQYSCCLRQHRVSMAYPLLKGFLCIVAPMCTAHW